MWIFCRSLRFDWRYEKVSFFVLLVTLLIAELEELDSGEEESVKEEKREAWDKALSFEALASAKRAAAEASLQEAKDAVKAAKAELARKKGGT